MFKIVDANVPDDSIIEELITNCHQAGYDCSTFLHLQPLLAEKNTAEKTLHLINPTDKKIEINCTDKNSIRINYQCSIPLSTLSEDCEKESLGEIPSSVKFTLEHTKNGVAYKDGELSMSIPKEFKEVNFGKKTVIDTMVGLFKNIREKLGFGSSSKDTKIVHKLGPEASFSQFTPQKLGSEAAFSHSTAQTTLNNSITEAVQKGINNNIDLKDCHQVNVNSDTITPKPTPQALQSLKQNSRSCG
jgi:hypothetical protein